MTRPLFLVSQFAGYLALLLFVWVWLGISERTAWHIAGSALLAAVIVAGLAWLLASAFGSRWWRGLLLLATLGALGLAGVWAAGRMQPRWAVWVTMALAAAALAPLVLTGQLRPLRSWQYWVAVGAVTAGGVYLPWKLVGWVPEFGSLTAQAASMALRFALAYGLSVSALLALAALVRRLAREDRSSPSSAPQPAHGD